LSQTDWDVEAVRAKNLTRSDVVNVDDSKEIDEEKLLKAEIKEDSS
jgi:hypothetical protein